MPSNREAYFEAIKLGVPESVVYFVLQEIDGYSRLELINRFDEEIKDYLFFNNALKRFINGEMIEYVFNKTYFLSKPFYVDKNVLIPRQETEQLVIRTKEIIVEMFGDKLLDVADVCAGSGVIGISLKNVLPNNNYYLTDISKEAIRVVKKNDPNIRCLIGDMLEPLVANNIKLDVIVCNPPYIEDESMIDEKTWRQEPRLALLAKPSTLFYQKVFEKSASVMKQQYLMAFEVGEDMEKALTAIIEQYGFSDYWFEKDIYGKTRFLFIKHQ